MGQFEPSLLAADAAERTRFLDALRATGSVAAAARATGTTRSTAYTLRRRDAEFAAAWTRIVAELRAAARRAPPDPPTPAETLEAALIARATHGVERYRFGKDSVEIWVEHDNRFGLDLVKWLRQRQPPAPAEPVRQMTRAEFIAAIEARPRTVDLPQG